MRPAEKSPLITFRVVDSVGAVRHRRRGDPGHQIVRSGRRRRRRNDPTSSRRSRGRRKSRLGKSVQWPMTRAATCEKQAAAADDTSRRLRKTGRRRPSQEARPMTTRRRDCGRRRADTNTSPSPAPSLRPLSYFRMNFRTRVVISVASRRRRSRRPFATGGSFLAAGGGAFLSRSASTKVVLFPRCPLAPCPLMSAVLRSSSRRPVVPSPPPTAPMARFPRPHPRRPRAPS